MSKNCEIDKCPNEASYLILNHGHRMYICWSHLKELHTPHNDPKVITLGHAAGFEMFERLRENYFKRKEELGIK